MSEVNLGPNDVVIYKADLQELDDKIERLETELDEVKLESRNRELVLFAMVSSLGEVRVSQVDLIKAPEGKIEQTEDFKTGDLIYRWFKTK